MKTLWHHFCQLSLFVQIFLGFCILGLLINSVLVYRDIVYSNSLLRLHLGFSFLYISQIIFILLHERGVCVLTALQGILALMTTADFVFSPLLRALGMLYYSFVTPSVEEIKVYKYVFVSLAFSLQMFSAYTLFDTLRDSSSKPQETTLKQE